MIIALVVGHRASKQGAMNVRADRREWSLNKEVVDSIASKVRNHEIIIIYRDDVRSGYSKLPAKINEQEPDFIICFHANAFNSDVSGTETLYYNESQTSKEYAQIFQSAMVNVLQLNDRGLVEIFEGDRGSLVLSKTTAPCILLEPFFIDNNDDYEIFGSNFDSYTDAMAETIDSL